MVAKFKGEGGEEKRCSYNLNKNSIVFDVGGYLGDFSAKIYNRYSCKIYIYEPVTEFYNHIVERFSGNDDVIVNNYGLSDFSGFSKISLLDDGSSSHKSGKKQDIRTVCVSDEIKKFDHIDLMKINIEGDEYCLLENLIETGMVNKINNIQIQFHNFVPRAEKRMLEIQKKLAKTHKLTFHYKFVWENWEKF